MSVYNETEYMRTEEGQHRLKSGNMFIVICIIISWLSALFFLISNNRWTIKLSDEVHNNFSEWKGLLTAGPKFKQGSDRLTYEVMMFVIYENEAYLRAYFHEAEVARTRDEAIDMIRNFKHGHDVIAQLEKGMEESNRLMDTEYHAMKLIAEAKGLDPMSLPPKVRDWNLSKRENEMTPEAKRALARELVFDHNYNDSKTRIGEAALASSTDIIARAHQQYENLRREIAFCSTLNKVLSSICISLMLISLYFVIRMGRSRLRSKEAKMLKIVTRERDNALAAEKSKSYFFASVSHDIRTPLNSIIGFTELLRIGDITGSERDLYLNGIETSGRQLLTLVNDILDLAKLEAGKYTFKAEPTDVGALVSEVVSSFLPQAQHAGLSIEAEIPESIHFPYLDRMRFRQVLVNLVSNAVKYTKQGGVTVSLACDETKHEFVVRVRDTGRGIRPEDIQRLMQPYVQLFHADERKGTGLGLAVTRQLVEAMNGKVEIESIVGVGSVFTVRLSEVRFADSETQHAVLVAEKAEQEKIAQLHNIGKSAFSGLKVLVVDDMALNKTVIKQLLKRLNVIDVDFASNGREALHKIETGVKYDVVFTDMWMPEMGGEEFIRIVRTMPQFRQLPVYAVTADVEILKNYAELGFTGTILKPVTLVMLRDILADCAKSGTGGKERA